MSRINKSFYIRFWERASSLVTSFAVGDFIIFRKKPNSPDVNTLLKYEVEPIVGVKGNWNILRPRVKDRSRDENFK